MINIGYSEDTYFLFVSQSSFKSFLNWSRLALGVKDPIKTCLYLYKTITKQKIPEHYVIICVTYHVLHTHNLVDVKFFQFESFCQDNEEEWKRKW